MLIKVFVLCLCLNMAKQGVKAASVVEVIAGHLAELPCLSSDDYHRFMFWQLTDDKHIIGPGNYLDEEKYNYEVLTGKLLIRGVSTTESGLYKCIARGIQDTSAIKIHTVELIVKTDIEAIVENSFETNLLRGMAAAMVVVVGIAVTLLVILLQRKKNQRFFDMMEESRENTPARYVGHVQSAPVTPAPRTLEAGGIDNMGMDVDFPKVFQQMQKGQANMPL
ncbi:uncharacterized protein LOC100680227 isoform X2 [Nasonia vitripennis]|nr:uncharacterized protein LOC100680227 isoform X2 [Nasonia vitripennis]